MFYRVNSAAMVVSQAYIKTKKNTNKIDSKLKFQELTERVKKKIAIIVDRTQQQTIQVSLLSKNANTSRNVLTTQRTLVEQRGALLTKAEMSAFEQCRVGVALLADHTFARRRRTCCRLHCCCITVVVVGIVCSIIVVFRYYCCCVVSMSNEIDVDFDFYVVMELVQANPELRQLQPTLFAIYNNTNRLLVCY
jgi:hypothetical protein